VSIFTSELIARVLMNEIEWLRSADACFMLDHLYPQRGHNSTPEQPRKLRLYLTALCRIEWKRLHPVCRATTELAERIADGEMADPTQRLEVLEIAEAMTTAEGNPEVIEQCIARLHALKVAVAKAPTRFYRDREWFTATWMAFLPLWGDLPNYKSIPAALHRADLVRCIFGNPFQPTPMLDDRDQTDEIRAFAKAMSIARDFASMPVLADMLEEAGCSDPAILEHCREKTDHVRGCWVIDLIAQPQRDVR